MVESDIVADRDSPEEKPATRDDYGKPGRLKSALNAAMRETKEKRLSVSVRYLG